MKGFDLEERFAVYAENVIDLCKTIKATIINRRIIPQVVGSSGSAGANYGEAAEAESTKDFQHKLGIVKKELRETKHWLRLLARTNPEKLNEIRILWQESHELLLIISKSIKTSKEKQLSGA